MVLFGSWIPIDDELLQEEHFRQLPPTDRNLVALKLKDQTVWAAKCLAEFIRRELSSVWNNLIVIRNAHFDV